MDASGEVFIAPLRTASSTVDKRQALDAMSKRLVNPINRGPDFELFTQLLANSSYQLYSTENYAITEVFGTLSFQTSSLISGLATSALSQKIR